MELRHLRAPILAVLFPVALNVGCNQASYDATAPAQGVKTSGADTAVTDKSSAPAFAPTVEGERKGLWLGGAPPINKRQSGIDTYYQLRAGDTPKHLTMKLRFEGVVADDALVRFSAIDGARFEPASQRTEWRLKPNIASEVTLNLVVPSTTSYLILSTQQNKRGASRAFLLELPSSRNAKSSLSPSHGSK